MKTDIMIVGGGMVGLTAACALAKQTTLSITVIEANKPTPLWQPGAYHHRVSAFSLSSKRIFAALDVWPAIESKRVSPFNQIEVWDAMGDGNIQFDSKEVAEPVLGYIIENDVVHSALMEKLASYPNVTYLSALTMSACQQTQNQIILTASDGRQFESKLAIAADGAHSWLRNQAEIMVNKIDYEQLGIVATVKTKLPHDKIARQVFLPTGPLAFLPLAEPHLCSIVWSVPVDEGKRLLALDDSEFKNELSEAFHHRLGEVEKCSDRFSFPLCQQQASHYVKNHVALVGDAAHVMHPLAGQGVNTGLLDAASLVEVVVGAYKQGRDFSSFSSLRRYERWRKADNQLMMTGVDRIKALFANEKSSAIHLRSFGLSMTNQFSLLKKIFVRHAVGARAGLPLLART